MYAKSFIFSVHAKRKLRLFKMVPIAEVEFHVMDIKLCFAEPISENKALNIAEADFYTMFNRNLKDEFDKEYGKGDYSFFFLIQPLIYMDEPIGTPPMGLYFDNEEI